MEGYKLCLSLAEAAPNLAAFASTVPLEALVALCVRGLDDESPAARYCTVLYVSYSFVLLRACSKGFLHR